MRLGSRLSCFVSRRWSTGDGSRVEDQQMQNRLLRDSEGTDKACRITPLSKISLLFFGFVRQRGCIADEARTAAVPTPDLRPSASIRRRGRLRLPVHLLNAHACLERRLVCHLAAPSRPRVRWGCKYAHEERTLEPSSLFSRFRGVAPPFCQFRSGTCLSLERLQRRLEASLKFTPRRTKLSSSLHLCAGGPKLSFRWKSNADT